MLSSYIFFPLYTESPLVLSGETKDTYLSLYAETFLLFVRVDRQIYCAGKGKGLWKTKLENLSSDV